jgi:hypothetical protein
MPYNKVATSRTPALIVYLLDCSGSMGEQFDNRSKIEHVNEALKRVLLRMVQRSTKGEVFSPRYRLALIAYSDKTYDLLGGIMSVGTFLRRGQPQLFAGRGADAASAFSYALDLLRGELPTIADHPAPFVLHLTDGQFTGSDPEPIANEIMQLSTSDGHVLIANVYFGTHLPPIEDIIDWGGIVSPEELSDPYLLKLFRMSSSMPTSYAETLHAEGYSLKPGCRMLLPAAHTDLIDLGFAMSGATPTS